MGRFELSVEHSPSEPDLAAIGTALAAFNEADVGPSGKQTLAVLVREDSRMVAGISGYTAWGWLYVQWLWVDAAQRGQGLAGGMLAAAECEAKNRGCHGAYIDTFNPHALHVYQKAGYTVFSAMPDFPVGRTRSFLSKTLT